MISINIVTKFYRWAVETFDASQFEVKSEDVWNIRGAGDDGGTRILPSVSNASGSPFRHASVICSNLRAISFIPELVKKHMDLVEVRRILQFLFYLSQTIR
jgi:hypothetical protein